MNLGLRSIFVHTSKILRHGADGFTSPTKEGMLRTLIALGRDWSRYRFGPMASTLAIIPQRTWDLGTYLLFVSYNISRVFITVSMKMSAQITWTITYQGGWWVYPFCHILGVVLYPMFWYQPHVNLKKKGTIFYVLFSPWTCFDAAERKFSLLPTCSKKVLKWINLMASAL
jgi:hypothetical protein